MTHAVLAAEPFGKAATSKAITVYRADPAAIHRELKREHVTLSALMDEYTEREPQGRRFPM